MPELPEVEVIRRSLRPHLLGRRITGVEVRHTALRRPVDARALERGVSGRRVLDLERRAKYLLIHLERRQLLVVHLGMSGRLLITRRAQPPARHDHLIFRLGRPTEATSGHGPAPATPGSHGPGRVQEDLRFHDPRRFGLVTLLAADDWQRSDLFRHLGPEPLDHALEVDYFVDRSRGRRAPVKNFLMDARVVVGVGNIYASEALHLAGIDPRTAAGKLGRRRWERVLAAVRDVLHRSIENGGTSIVDFRDGVGRRGLHRIELAVYDRAGERCRRCGRRVRRVVQSGRSTFFCGGCQR